MAVNTSRPEAARAEYENSTKAGFIRFPDKPFPHSMLLVFEEYNYDNFETFKNLLTNSREGLISQNRQSGVGLRSTSSIELPFPKQLQDSNSLIVNGFSRDPLTEGLTKQISDFAKSGNGNIGDIPQTIQNMGADAARAASGGNAGTAIRSIANQISATSTADATNIGMYLLRKFLPDSIGKSVNLATGQVLNPRETLAFEGVQLRQHQFSWDLYPSNAQDSAKIQDIIKHLKRSVLPVTQDLGTEGQIAEAFLRYPHICKIYLLGVDSEYYMKFKPAMVTSMTVDYGAGGNLAIMQGGRPAGVNISLSFQELQIETANDYGAVSPTGSPGGIPADTTPTAQEQSGPF